MVTPCKAGQNMYAHAVDKSPQNNYKEQISGTDADGSAHAGINVAWRKLIRTRSAAARMICSSEIAIQPTSENAVSQGEDHCDTL